MPRRTRGRPAMAAGRIASALNRSSDRHEGEEAGAHCSEPGLKAEREAELGRVGIRAPSSRPRGLGAGQARIDAAVVLERGRSPLGEDRAALEDQVDALTGRPLNAHPQTRQRSSAETGGHRGEGGRSRAGWPGGGRQVERAAADLREVDLRLDDPREGARPSAPRAATSPGWRGNRRPKPTIRSALGPAC